MNRSEQIEHALKLCMRELCNVCGDSNAHIDHPCIDQCETLRIAKEALAMPRRNCDVGTADEQSQMFDTFCNGVNCEDCPIHYIPGDCYCTLAWAQMPYKEGDEK